MVVINHQYGGNKSPNMVVIDHQYGGNKPLFHNGGYYPPVLVVYTIHPLSTDFGGLFPPVFLQCTMYSAASSACSVSAIAVYIVSCA